MAGLTAELKSQGVEFVRFCWVDNANVMRAKAVHINHLRSVYEYGVGISFAQQAVPVVRDAFVPESGLGPVGEVRLLGNWQSLALLPYAVGHARVMCDMFLDGDPWAHCPRDFLRRMIAEATEMGLTIETAFENEFYLFQPQEDGGFRPIDETIFCSLNAMNRSVDFLGVLVQNLEAQGVHPVMFHPESGNGQFEMSIEHTDPLTAADQQLIFRETVHAVANQGGLLATFLPKPIPEQAGSGCHIHLSLWRDGENLTAIDRDAGETARQFMAGVHKHIPALMGLTTPTRNSFSRIGRHLWSGGFSCWGYDNREAAIRVPTHPYGISHFELKTHDATANPYLALGGIIAAGLDGVRKKMEPTEPLDVDPGLLSSKERKSRGIKELPENLKTVLNSLEKSKLYQEKMGPELMQSYLSVKREELKSISPLTPEDEVRMLLERY